MEDHELKIQLAQKNIRANDKAGKPYCFSIIAEFKEPGKEDFKVVKGAIGDRAFTDNINLAIKQLKANRLRIFIYKGKTENADKIDDTIVIELPDAPAQSMTATRQTDDVLSRIDVLIKQNETFLQQNQQLSGVVEQKTVQLSDMQHTHERDLLGIKHEIELTRLNEALAKKSAEINELTAELKEATTELTKFQEIFSTEEKLEKGARTTTAILKGVLSVAPGLIKYAQTNGLGGLATALISDGEEGPQQANEPQGPGDEPIVEIDAEKFQKTQAVLGFTQSLSEVELEQFIFIIGKIDGNKKLLETLTEMLKTE